MLYIIILFLLVVILFVIYKFSFESVKIYKPLKITYIDPAKYMGRWFEIARLPTLFQNGCSNVTAYYELSANNIINISNKCKIGKTYIEANAIAINNFQPLFINDRTIIPGSFDVYFNNVNNKSEYNILYVDNDYQYAVVGSKDRQYLWFLSRSPYTNDFPKIKMLNIAKSNDYNIDNLIWSF